MMELLFDRVGTSEKHLRHRGSLRFTLVIACVLCCIRLWAQAQITFTPYEDNNLSGYKSIVFEYEEKTTTAPGQPAQARKVKKEFDIEANNPFYKMGFKMSNPDSGKRTLYIDKSSLGSLKNKFGVAAGNVKASSNEAEFGATHTFVSEEKNHVVLSYNLFLYDESGEHIDEERFASILVLDKQGSIVNKVEDIPTDAYGTAISENGKYLAYGFGEPWHGTLPESLKSGFRIVDMETGKIHYELEVGYVEGVSSSRDMLVIAYIDEKGREKIVLDAKDGSVYGPMQFDLTLGRFKFMQTDGTVIELKDLRKIK